MKKLEFLLQKEGDRAWLPLETPDVEILEGRYRVVARIQHPNTDIEIRVTYTCFDQVPPVRQIQSRSARTNQEGLVVIIPYTRLKPGMWELSCLPDAKSKQAKTWQYGVQLQVLPAESETPAPLEPADSAEASAEPDRAVESDSTAAAEIAPAPEPQPTKIYQLPSPQTPQPKSQSKLQLVLDRETFVAQVGRPLIISGQIDFPQTPSPSPESQAEEFKKLIGSAQLHVYLRDPQTSELLAQIQQPLPEQTPPCIFACVTYIPAECKSRLILGEAVLNSAGTSLATQVFTITARLERLLEVIEDNFTEQKHSRDTYPTAPKQVQKAPNLSFLKLVEKPSETLSPTSAPTNEPLPPKLSTRQTPAAADRLELPAFGRKLPEGSRSQLLSEIANSPQNPAVKTPASSIELPTESQPKNPRSPSQIQFSEPPNSAQNTESAPADPQLENSPQPETRPSATKQAFQTLKVETRFWSRLSALASTRESPEWLKETALPPSQKPVGGGATSLVRDSSSQVQQSTETSGLIAETPPVTSESREFVVFDEPAPPKKVAAAASPEVEETPLSPYVLPEDDAVPMPVLNLPRGEIVAGQLVKVTVRLPELMPRIYVKIWVYDRQTYMILDGPRWISEFASSGLGNVEATAELQIPYGCLEVEFEAIAVEMQTQRESHKVTVHRQISPPAGPSLPLEG